MRGESFTISGPDGDITPGGDHGVYVRDNRYLNRLTLLVNGLAPAHLSGASIGGHRATFHGYLPPSGDTEIDPTILVNRRRVVDGGLREEIDILNVGARTEVVDVRFEVGADFAYIFDVKHGRVLPASPARTDGQALEFTRIHGDERALVRLEGGTANGTTLSRRVTVAAGTTTTLVLLVTATDRYGQATPRADAQREATSPAVGIAGPRSHGPGLRCSDSRFSRLVRRSLADLKALDLHDPQAPGDRFSAAGSPWFLTLFGRDSLWAALMSLPFDPSRAASTLRVLARRQGTRIDDVTEEQPGKILHEVRRGTLSARGDLPAVYYGSIDSTPLFVILAHEAWKWGLHDDELRPLLGNIEAALAWMRDFGDSDGDGFLEYARRNERGLANQGWKDSGDGIRYADGRVASAPLALCEVQGYAYAAAIRGAELLDHFARPGGEGWRDYAAELAARFRTSFWVSDPDGDYPATALDAGKIAVDGVASNMGHLLMTGLVDADEAALIADRLSSRAMSSGWGLRTLSADSGGYNPLSYHCGTVWPHDTAIAAWGLARTGHGGPAAALLKSLTRAAPTFSYRLPELFSGFSPDDSAVPVPYPTACRPQAWAAGGALLLTRALLGMEADLPNRHLVLRPMTPAPFASFELSGLGIAGGTIDIRLRGEQVSVDVHGADVDVMIEHR